MIKFYNEDCLNSFKHIKNSSVDLFFCDSPYYISGSTKQSNIDLNSGTRQDWDRQWNSKEDYYDWCKLWMQSMYTQLKDSGSAYICISWQHSGHFQELLESIGFIILNRITWKRDKGRGSSKNYKSLHEDIWFCVKDENKYIFNIKDVMIEKKVLAPYVDGNGEPKDWYINSDGQKVRMTYPSNLWEEFSVPFWSMKEVRSYAKTIRTPENLFEKHNTQKPKDLVKRCILASSNEEDLVVDYFSGSGTTAIAAEELKRNSVVFDLNSTYIEILKTRMKNEMIKDTIKSNKLF